MASLVGYGSSDEEDDVRPDKPAKIARIEKRQEDSSTVTGTNLPPQPTEADTVSKPSVAIDQSEPLDEDRPTLGPSTDVNAENAAAYTPASAPSSPYTTERQRIQELTMPTVPNFDIPDSPPPLPSNSEAAATLAATTKKFERFLELKKQGVHFNERLQHSAALRNPGLLPKLLDFAHISPEESYASTLPEGIAVPVSWPKECYVDALVKTNEKKERRRKEGRDGIEFVSASASGSKKSSAVSTPQGSSAATVGEIPKTRGDVSRR